MALTTRFFHGRVILPLSLCCELSLPNASTHSHFAALAINLKICRYFILPSSIEAGSSKARQCRPIVLPTRTTIQGAFVPALEPVRRKSGAQGELCLRALFTQLQFKKALELFGSAPNSYFLSRALRPARMVSWLFVWGGQFVSTVKAIEVHLP